MTYSLSIHIQDENGQVVARFEEMEASANVIAAVLRGIATDIHEETATSVNPFTNPPYYRTYTTNASGMTTLYDSEEPSDDEQ